MKAEKERIAKVLGVLTPEQFTSILWASRNGIPILIDGVRKPTGKSTLCELLRECGIEASEPWEYEEGGLKRKEDVNEAHLLITLNKLLDTKVQDPRKLVRNPYEAVPHFEKVGGREDE